MRHAAAALALAVLLPASPRADPLEDRSAYVLAKLGGSVPSQRYTDPTGLTTTALRSAPTWEVAVGWSRIFGLELSAGRTTTAAGGMDVSAVPVLLAARLQLPLPVPGVWLAPYAAIGAGLWFSRATLGALSDTDTAFGFHAGAGVDLDLGAFLLGVEGRYRWVEPSFGPIGEVRLEGFEALAKAGVRF